VLVGTYGSVGIRGWVEGEEKRRKVRLPSELGVGGVRDVNGGLESCSFGRVDVVLDERMEVYSLGGGRLEEVVTVGICCWTSIVLLVFDTALSPLSATRF
jgi:hypothetical protein